MALLSCSNVASTGAREHPPDGRVFDESGMEIDPNEEVIARIVRHGAVLGVSSHVCLMSCEREIGVVSRAVKERDQTEKMA